MKRAALLMFLMPFAAPSQAATREDVYQAFQRCNVIRDDRTWLDCIYGAAQPVRAALNLAPAPDSQVRLVPQGGIAVPMPVSATHTEPRHEGFVSYMLGGRKQVEAMPMRAYQFGGDGRFTVTLVNGQTWRQMDDDSHLAQWKADPAHYVASIKTGALGSSIMQVRGETGAFLVKQVR